MTTDFRALCAELLIALENAISIIYYEDGTKHISTAKPIVNRARAALADEPAVPEGREPVAVTGQPSDDNCWQWYTYCPEEGLEMYSDREQAQSAAQSIMGSYEVAAHSDGWHEDMESVSWGMLVPVEQAQVVERKTADPDSEFDEWVKYELKTPRWGHQPAHVPVSERWPEFSDCDDADRVWCWSWAIGTWRLSRINRSIHTHWLPAHALPIPQQQETVND